MIMVMATTKYFDMQIHCMWIAYRNKSSSAPVTAAVTGAREEAQWLTVMLC
jgi:hypothetical protein